MTWTVGVGVGALTCGIPDMAGVDSYAPRLLLRSPVYLVVGQVLCHALVRLDLGDGGSEGGLPMVHMADGAYIAVRQVTQSACRFITRICGKKPWHDTDTGLCLRDPLPDHSVTMAPYLWKQPSQNSGSLHLLPTATRRTPRNAAHAVKNHNKCS